MCFFGMLVCPDRIAKSLLTAELLTQQTEILQSPVLTISVGIGLILDEEHLRAIILLCKWSWVLCSPVVSIGVIPGRAMVSENFLTACFFGHETRQSNLSIYHGKMGRYTA